MSTINDAYYADEIEDGEWGVFHEDTDSRCYYTSSQQDCEEEVKRLNKILTK